MAREAWLGTGSLAVEVGGAWGRERRPDGVGGQTVRGRGLGRLYGNPVDCAYFAARCAGSLNGFFKYPFAQSRAWSCSMDMTSL